jgi:D-tyrosyl-tRNA(Tyr) deacylase
MRVVIQRVNRASVTVVGQVTGSIELGLCLLVGITHEDTREDIRYIVNKTLNMRIFPDQTGDSGFDESVMDVNGGLLLVSQFTLYASTRKGRRPGFTDAARPEQAQPMFDELVDTFRMNSSLSVETGVFGASMTVDIENAGPVTITLDSAERSAPRKG